MPLDSHVPMGRGGTKWFSDLLGPLYKFLRRQVGRPWDKVFAEMSAHLRPTSTVQQHVFVHVWQFVERYAVERGGRVLHQEGLHELREGRLFVCPRTRLLRVYRAPAPANTRTTRKRQVVSGEVEHRWLQGAWYAVYFAAIPSFEKDPFAFDVVLCRRLYGRPGVVLDRRLLAIAHNRQGVYAYRRRKLSRSERIVAGLSPRPVETARGNGRRRSPAGPL